MSGSAINPLQLQWVFAEIPSVQDHPPANSYLEWAFAESPSHSVQDLPDTWEDVGPLPNVSHTLSI